LEEIGAGISEEGGRSPEKSVGHMFKYAVFDVKPASQNFHPRCSIRPTPNQRLGGRGARPHVSHKTAHGSVNAI